jgi:predicted ATPase
VSSDPAIPLAREGYPTIARWLLYAAAFGAVSHYAHGLVASALESLAERDLLVRQSPGTYTFRHIVIREVAYATLPRARRRERHKAIALFLEEAVGDVGDVAPALAHHWQEAGEPARAAHYLIAAGDQANRGWAKEQAATYYEQALLAIPAEQTDLRRDVAKRYAVAAQASLHAPEVLAGRSAPRSAENRPE